MKIQYYSKVYTLWINTPGMELNDIDDSKAGIKKYLKRNPKTCLLLKKELIKLLSKNFIKNSMH